MNKKVPFKTDYDLVKAIDKYSSYLLCTSTIMIIVIFIFNNLTSYLSFGLFLSKLNCVLITSYVIIEILKEYLLFNARRKKRFDLIDNALGSSLTTEHSFNYYTNDNIEQGIFKLAVNGFENVFFSLNIIRAMLPKALTINAVILLIFLSSAIYGFNNIVVLIIQLSLPVIMLKQIFRLIFLVNHLENIYHRYCSIFNDLKLNPYKLRKTPEMICNILEYESTLSWANILMSEKDYNKMNDLLSARWTEIKKNYGIII